MDDGGDDHDHTSIRRRVRLIRMRRDPERVRDRALVVARRRRITRSDRLETVSTSANVG
jgi:hypothetical protein